jgi:serine/threonine protein kinase
MPMSPLPCAPHRWPRFSECVDVLLALPNADREPWLAALPPKDADLRPPLRRLLQGLAAPDDGFLVKPQAMERPLQPGQRIGPYALIAPLGRGGMGRVWRACRADGAYAREVALKLPHQRLNAAEPPGHFERERDLLARLVHPGIATFYDAGIAPDGQPYLAMEIVHGEPITDWCGARGLAPRVRVALLLQAADALQYAHTQFVAHLDLKPAHVLVTDARRVQLLDFSIASRLGEADAPGAATPGYAAPEQRDGRPAGVAADVYALGVVAHEVLTGRLPETGGPLPHGDLGAIIARALQHDPAARYATMADFAADLRAWLAHRPVAAHASPVWRRAGLALRRRPGVAAIAACLLLGVAGTAWQVQRNAAQARQTATVVAHLTALLDHADPRVGAARSAGDRTLKGLLDERLSTLLADTALPPDTLQLLLDRAATVYVYLDEPAAAVRLQQRRVEMMATHLPAGDAGLLDARLSLVWALQTQRDVGASATQMALLDKALATQRLGRLHAELALARHDQALLESRPALSHAKAADTLYRQHAPGDAGHAAALAHLAEAELQAGRPESARAFLDEALAIRTQPASQRARLLDARARASADPAGALRDGDAAVALLRGSLGLASGGARRVLAGQIARLCAAGQPGAARALRAEGPASAPHLDAALQNCS